MNRALLLLTGLWLIATGVDAAEANRLAFMDDHGVLRWQDNGAEIALFGVNYYPPFHWNYRDIKQLGLSHDKVIDQDLAHFSRMGLDVIRLHVFDREISDRNGNLVDNDHLRLLDYLIAQARKRGIYVVLTPIAWWAVPKESPGFSTFFTMHQMTTDTSSWPAQKNYMNQFARHVNRFTGMAYRHDPAIVAFELINEPHYPEGTTDEQITNYINALADTLHSTGCSKPIFYNGWGNRIGCIRDARIDGSSFVWYPSGLASGKSKRKNFLPFVDTYGNGGWTPSMRSEQIAKKAKIVYEFDAADIPGSYMYPAMARSFRSGGAQIATQFQYDPLPLAADNAGWQTHFLNLVYSPSRAMSFLIAGEAFRHLPRLQEYGRYPDNRRFGPFRVNFDEDLSEMVTDRDFFYSNDTRTEPPASEKLERVFGCGSSTVVRYEGTGAYFLERLSAGAWRLEVYPDAVWVNDPFGNTKLGKEVSRALWHEWPMKTRLPDLGNSFKVSPLNEGNSFQSQAHNGEFRIRPGIYLLIREEASHPQMPPQDFVAPTSSDAPLAVWHEPTQAHLEGKILPLKFSVATATDPETVTLELAGKKLQPSRIRACQYKIEVPGDLIKPGQVSYRLAVQMSGKTAMFPKDKPAWTVPVVKKGAPVVLFEAGRHPAKPEGRPAHQERLVPGMTKDHQAQQIAVNAFGPPPSSLKFRNEIAEELEARRDDLSNRKMLRLRMRALEATTTAVEVVLVEDNNVPWGLNVPLTTEWREVQVPVSSLRYFKHWLEAPKTRGSKGDQIKLQNLTAISFSFGAWLYPEHIEEKHTIEIESVVLE